VGVSPWLSDDAGTKGGIQFSPGLAAKYPRYIVGDPAKPAQFVNALVRLRHGQADIASFDAGLKRVTGRSDIDLLRFPDQARSRQHEITFVSRCLVAFAAAAFLAALVLVGQAVARYAAASTAELQTMRALGMTPRQVIVTASVGPALVGVVGAVLAGVAAWLVSSAFPFGTAKLYEPSPGRRVDWLVTLTGAAAAIVLLAFGAALAARLASSSALRKTSMRPSTVAAALRRSGAPVPVVVGARFALETGRGRAAVPVRPALIGSVAGVLGVLAAFTFSRGVSDAADHPERFGQTFALNAFAGFNDQDFAPSGKIATALLAQPQVTGLDDSRTAVASDPSGRATVSLWEYRRSAKPMPIVVLDGRAPVAADEVVLAPETLTILHAHVGGTVTLVGSRKTAHTMRVVGRGLVPEGPHNGYADGGWIAPGGYDALFTGFKYHILLISIPHAADADRTAATLTRAVNRALPELDGGASIGLSELPLQVAQIREVRTLPIVLGGFLAVLAVGAVGHALATAVRRRSHDLAVLRAAGMTPWQCRGVVVTQASVLGLMGLAFGVPLGVALGRTVWRAVADYTPVQYVPPLASVVLAGIVPAALLVANALAAWPGQRAARLRIAAILRAE
ncbi:MAG TPA: ABC transporter permease, partial [Jatrophihabitantaceae bacterium]|nr:ABC transporter permease [Jatrophihabitantaceae bacterium]